MKWRSMVDGKWLKKRVYNREDCNRLLRMAKNRHILHMPMEKMNEFSGGPAGFFG
jgi:hypothetical protein